MKTLGTPSRTPNAIPIAAICFWVMIVFALPFSTSGNALFEQSPSDSFPKVRKVFETRCLSCHNNALKMSGFSLESAEGLRQGGIHGPVVVPGDLQHSRLYLRVARLEKPYMPTEDSLTAYWILSDMESVGHDIGSMSYATPTVMDMNMTGFARIAGAIAITSSGHSTKISPTTTSFWDNWHSAWLLNFD